MPKGQIALQGGEAVRIGQAAVVLIVSLALVGVACGDDDGSGVRDLGGSASSGSGSGAASGSASASGTAACEDVGEASTADVEVPTVLKEWAVEPETDSVASGSVHFEAINEGEDEHELVVVKADSVEELPLADDDTVDETQLPEGAFIGEVEAFPSGETCNGTFDLEPGNYVLFCNLVHDEEGEIENHFQLGMRTEFTVE
jgi:hypothetical protein